MNETKRENLNPQRKAHNSKMIPNNEKKKCHPFKWRNIKIFKKTKNSTLLDDGNRVRFFFKIPLHIEIKPIVPHASMDFAGPSHRSYTHTHTSFFPKIRHISFCNLYYTSIYLLLDLQHILYSIVLLFISITTTIIRLNLQLNYSNLALFYHSTYFREDFLIIWI